MVARGGFGRKRLERQVPSNNLKGLSEHSVVPVGNSWMLQAVSVHQALIEWLYEISVSADSVLLLIFEC
jgi:hypothetical protein